MTMQWQPPPQNWQQPPQGKPAQQTPQPDPTAGWTPQNWEALMRLQELAQTLPLPLEAAGRFGSMLTKWLMAKPPMARTQGAPPQNPPPSWSGGQWGEAQRATPAQPQNRRLSGAPARQVWGSSMDDLKSLYQQDPKNQRIADLMKRNGGQSGG